MLFQTIVLKFHFQTFRYQTQSNFAYVKVVAFTFYMEQTFDILFYNLLARECDYLCSSRFYAVNSPMDLNLITRGKGDERTEIVAVVFTAK